jgi:hypothetical protein
MFLFLVQLLLEKFKCNIFNHLIITKNPLEITRGLNIICNTLFIIRDFEDRPFKII